MRLLRMFGSLVLGAIVSAVLVSTFGCKREAPAVIRVDTAAEATYPVLRKGQILRWEGPANAPYSIMWIGNSSPCKDNKAIIQSTPVNGKETVTCEVETPPTAGHYYAYTVGPYSASKVLDNTKPCYGCTYYSDDSDLIALNNSAAAAPPNVSVSCAIASPGGITLDPPTYQLAGATSLKWYSEVQVQITSITFPHASSIPCSNSSGPWKCDFSSAVGNSWNYMLAATGTGATPPYCGTNTPDGTISTGMVTK